MNDEIKEILDKLQNYENYKFRSENGRSYKEIEAWEIELLLDYITNLQKENEILKEELIHKPDNKITLKTDDGKEMFIIQSERIDMQEELNKTNMQLMKRIEDYKSRNEEAIGYVKNLKNYRFEFTFDNVDRHEIVGCTHNFVKDLLNILQGSDKE